MFKILFAIISTAIVVSCHNNRCPSGKLFHENSKCYTSGSGPNSPCVNEHQTYSERQDKPGWGTCTCINFIGDTSRPVVQWKENNQCYWVFDQGPCKKGEWLTFSQASTVSKQRVGVCTKRTCPENEKKDADHHNVWFDHNGKCLQVGVTNPEFCGNEQEKVYFALEKPEPVCMEVRPTVITVTENRNHLKKRRVKRYGRPMYLRCPPGYKQLRNGECKRIATFGPDYYGRVSGRYRPQYLRCPRGYKQLQNGECKKITHFGYDYYDYYG